MSSVKWEQTMAGIFLGRTLTLAVRRQVAGVFARVSLFGGGLDEFGRLVLQGSGAFVRV